VTLVEFCEDLWRLKTRVPGLSCCLCDPTFSSFSRTPTCDRRTQTHGYYCGCIASRGKNVSRIVRDVVIRFCPNICLRIFLRSFVNSPPRSATQTRWTAMQTANPCYYLCTAIWHFSLISCSLAFRHNKCKLCLHVMVKLCGEIKQ